MSRKKTNKVKFELETEGGEIAQVPNNKKKPFKIERGGIAKPLGNGFYYLQGKSHENGGIDMTFNTDARIFSSVPFLNGKSPAERVMRGENPDTTFAWQEEFKDVNGINDDGSRKKAENGKEIKVTPTREEYITSKINSTINAALDKSRTRKYPSSPLILDSSYKTDTDLYVTNGYIDAYSGAAAAAANKGNYEDYYKFMDKATHYAKRKNYLQNLKDRGLCEGNSCIYTTTDNYGKQYRVASNVEFAKDPNKYGFIKIDTADRKVGDLQQRVVDHNNHPYHMMMLNGIDEHGLARYNYSAGGSDEISIRVNARYPLEEGEHIDTYRFVGTPQDSVRWTNEYNKLYMDNNKKRLGGSTGLIRVQANGKDKLMFIPFTGEETKASRKKAEWGAYADDTTYNNFNDYLTERAKKFKDYSIIDPSKLTIAQKADIDWMHNNLMNTGVDAADRTDYLSSNEGTLYKGQKKTPLYEQRIARETAGMNYAKNYQIDGDRFKPVIINPDEIKETKVSEVTNKQVRQQTRAALKKEGLDWVSRNKDWAAPAISALSNGLASLLSYKINKDTLGDMTYADRPIPKRALPRITKVNKEPELNVVRENLARNIENTIANISSSRVANSIISDMGLNATLAMNKIYADKENQERDLLNTKLANDQEIINANIDAENVWRKGKSDFENAIRDQQSENAVSLVDNINKGIQTGITDAEKRRQFRNNLAIMAAAYPNVTPALLRSYGADFLRMGGKVKLNKKK